MDKNDKKVKLRSSIGIVAAIVIVFGVFYFYLSRNPDSAHSLMVANRYEIIPGEMMTILRKQAEEIQDPEQGGQAFAYGNRLSVYQVDPELAIAWKRGNFDFNNEKLEAIMQKIANWYKVDMVYRNNMSDILFSGSVSRSNKLSVILQVLELTGAVKFEIQDRTVYVMNR